jgi:S-DNA-T family DNA segregation ATPase FtsK/SpoIIIE
MAKKKPLPKDVAVPKASFFDDLSPQAKQAIAAVVMAIIGVFFLASLFEVGGPVGHYTYVALSAMFGTGAYLSPLICGFYVYALLNPKDDNRVSGSKVIGIAVFFLAVLGLLEHTSAGLGGWTGLALQWPLEYLLGGILAGVILFGLALISVFLMFNTGLHVFGKKEFDYDDDSDIEGLEIPDDEPEEVPAGKKKKTAPEVDDAPADEPIAPKRPLVDAAKESLGLGTKGGEFVVSTFRGTYAPPPLSLLKKDTGKAQTGDVKANANIIKRTLKEFGINVEMDAVEIGPTITRYALKPAQGVKIARIVGLQQELQLNLSTSALRIEAPIPGKSLVGIEIPNLQRATVGLASLLKTPEYTDSPHPLLVALGKDVTGHAHFANVARMPHALIAGTTGSGKSIMIHNLVVSLLFRNSPDQLRLFMVDPKRVELTLYEGIPHLLSPVITDAKKTLLMLKWAVKEMERRYDVLQGRKIQNIDSYHQNIYQPAKKEFEAKGSPEEERLDLPEAMPYIVIIMDELADLMLAFPRELEALIVRLAQMSRAVGIHLVLATQRPSVNVITGTIKANIPTRLAFNVASQIDSRTIIDQVGADKLLGRGDMLFLSNDSPKPIRLQSAFVSEEETKNVVAYLKEQIEAQGLDSINFDEKSGGTGDSFIGMLQGNDGDDDDDLYEDAKQAVIEAGKASTSYIQRKLRVGYSRAARLMDLLEEKGVIGPADGAKPRQVLATGDMGGHDDDETGESEDRDRGQF